MLIRRPRGGLIRKTIDSILNNIRTSRRHDRPAVAPRASVTTGTACGCGLDAWDASRKAFGMSLQGQKRSITTTCGRGFLRFFDGPRCNPRPRHQVATRCKGERVPWRGTDRTVPNVCDTRLDLQRALEWIKQQRSIISMEHVSTKPEARTLSSRYQPTLRRR